MTAISSPRIPKKRGRSGTDFLLSLPASLATAIGLLITAVLFLWMHHHEQQLEDAHFERRASAYVTAVQNRLGDAVQALAVINQAFKTFPSITHDQFRAFTEPLLARYPYIQNFSFHQFVSQSERPGFEAEMRRDYPDFSITDIVHGKRTSAPVRDRYRVISYIEPMIGNELVFGLDAAAFTSGQNDAIRRASITGRPAATELYDLPQTIDGQRGFSVHMSVYRNGADVDAFDNISNRLHAAVGYTNATFRAGDFVEKILKTSGLLSDPYFNVSVYADDSVSDYDLVFRKGDAPSMEKSGALFPEWLFRDQPNTLSQTFELAGAPWHIEVSARPAPFAEYHLGSLLVLLGGTFISFLAAGCMQMLASRSNRAQHLVDERTAELKVANERLRQDIEARERVEQELRHTQHILVSAQKVAHVGSWVFDVKTGELQCSDEYFRICGLEPQSVKLSLDFAAGVSHSEDQKAAKEIMATSLAECKEYRSERRIVRPDGSIRYIVSRGEPIFNEAQELQTYVGAYLDITEQKEAEIALCQSREKLRELAAHLERVREEERKRIAREVHDELGSLLTGIKAHLSVAIDHGVRGAKPIDKLLVEAVKLTDVATETVRRVITDLRPSVLDHLGVWAALEWYVDQVQQRLSLTRSKAQWCSGSSRKR
jgi:PAS domain S-box-containing protein